MSKIELTVGMATYQDYDGVFFTIQSMRAYQDCSNVEFLVIDNYGCEYTKKFVQKIGGKYIEDKQNVGTSHPRNRIFREARGNAVLCVDCHVLLEPNALFNLKKYYRENPDCLDLIQGPLWHDDLKTISTQFDEKWSGQMWGTWGYNEEIEKGEPIEIPMQGLGLFSCIKRAWLGFSHKFKGFGGEEGYIHEKYRQARRKCLCMPWLKWCHRFDRPNGVKYPLRTQDKLRNYLIGHTELNMDLEPIIDHFAPYVTLKTFMDTISEALGENMTLVLEPEEEPEETLNNNDVYSKSKISA